MPRAKPQRPSAALLPVPALVLALLLVLLLRPQSGAAPPAPPPGVLGTYVRGPHTFSPGTPGALRVVTHYATSPSESAPARDIPIEVRLSSAGRAVTLLQGRSDADGVLDVLFTVPAWPAGPYTLTVVSRPGPGEARAAHPVTLVPEARVLLQSDKPLYQPGQTIHLRALAVRTQDGHPLQPAAAPATDHRGAAAAPATDHRGAAAAPATDHRGAAAAPATENRGAAAAPATENRGAAAAPATENRGAAAALAMRFEVLDPRGNRVFSQTQPLSPFGIAAVDVPLAEELLLGGYRARAALEEPPPARAAADAPGSPAAPTELALEVARYVLPTFKVSVDTDQSSYGPGARVGLQIKGRYFHGRPVAGGQVTVRATLQSDAGAAPRAVRDESLLATLHADLDATGQAQLEVTLPADLARRDALQLEATIVDKAEHRERAARLIPISEAPLAVDIAAEAGAIVGGVPNRLWVIATRRDGSAAARAAVSLRVSHRGQELPALPAATTDAIGVASFTLPLAPPLPPKPGFTRGWLRRPHGRACGESDYIMTASVSDGAGHSVQQERCLPLAERGGLLLRTDRALYPRGAPIRARIEAPGSQGTVYLDLLRERQLVSTAAVLLRDGVGEVELPPDERRFGTLVVQAYHIAADGLHSSDARLIYVDRSAALQVHVTPQLPAGQEGFRPGERGQIHLRVVDAASGAGVPAALGVVMVDEALLALRPLRAGATRTYFTLTEAARRAGAALGARPAGHTIEALVEDGAPADALRQEAAQILLAGARPPWELGWEIDPWQKRSQDWEGQQQRLREAMLRFQRGHLLGERDPMDRSRWRWRADLLPALVQGAGLRSADLRDPWARPNTGEQVRALAELPEGFADYAQAELEQRLTTLYRALLADLPRLAVDPTVSGKPAARVLTLADLQRLLGEGKLARKGKSPALLLLDPWGNPLRLVERRRPFEVIAGLRSRFVLASAGPDGVPDSRDDLYAAEGSCKGCHDSPWVSAEPAETAFAAVRGLCGCGYGYGSGHGALGGRSVSVPSIRAASAGSDPGKEDRVRSSFPETLLWQPSLMTDGEGRATLDVDFADSITTWRLSAEAIAADGRLGQALAPVRVLQDFFADVDVPGLLTQHDELAIPVAVHNYLKVAQRVEVRLEGAPWFEHQGEAVQHLDLAPGEVGARHFRIRVTGVGPQTLRAHARGAHVGDAVERGVRITPDGAERVLAFQDRVGPLGARHALRIPQAAIPGASEVTLKVYPSLATHVLEGLDSLLRMPSGCFEQTSSTTYPNALILEYLRRTGKSTPQIEERALRFLQTGYQRLLSFEVRGGGFSWFGESPANQVLTAYGLEEFHDMARVFPVDPAVIERTRRWLLRRQRQDGSFAPDTNSLHDGVTEGLTADVTRITAFIAVSLQRSGAPAAALERSRAFVSRALREHPTKDPFTLVLAAELLPAEREALAAQLWGLRQEAPGGPGASFLPLARTPTYGDGVSARIEGTALAARLLLRARGGAARAERALAYLLSVKDAQGNWHSTQATIRTLQALLAFTSAGDDGARGRLLVQVDGQLAATLTLSGEALQVQALRAASAVGDHQVTLRFEGRGRPAYQLVGRYYTPAVVEAVAAEAPLQVAATLEPRQIRVGEPVTLQVSALLRGGTALDMPLIQVGLPAGFDCDRAALEMLVRGRKIEKFELAPRAVVLYLRRLAPGSEVALRLPMQARLSGQMQLPAPVLYEYYQPERRAEGQAQRVQVAR